MQRHPEYLMRKRMLQRASLELLHSTVQANAAAFQSRPRIALRHAPWCALRPPDLIISEFIIPYPNQPANSSRLRSERDGRSIRFAKILAAGRPTHFRYPHYTLSILTRFFWSPKVTFFGSLLRPNSNSKCDDFWSRGSSMPKNANYFEANSHSKSSKRWTKMVHFGIWSSDELPSDLDVADMVIFFDEMRIRIAG